MCTLIRLEPVKPHYPRMSADQFYELIEENEHYYSVRDGLVGPILTAEKSIWFISETVNFDYSLRHAEGKEDMRIRLQRLPADVDKKMYDSRYVEIDAEPPRRIWRRITPVMATAFKSFLKEGFYRRDKEGRTVEVRMKENFKVMATEHELRRRAEKQHAEMKRELLREKKLKSKKLKKKHKSKKKPAVDD